MIGATYIVRLTHLGIILIGEDKKCARARVCVCEKFLN